MIELGDDIRAALQHRFRQLLEVGGVALAELAESHDDCERVIDAVLHFTILSMKFVNLRAVDE